MKINISFNPCFNGFSTYTTADDAVKIMLNSFNPCFNGFSTYTNPYAKRTIRALECFNPCFNGFSTYTQLKPIAEIKQMTFQSLF